MRQKRASPRAVFSRRQTACEIQKIHENHARLRLVAAATAMIFMDSRCGIPLIFCLLPSTTLSIPRSAWRSFQPGPDASS